MECGSSDVGEEEGGFGNHNTDGSRTGGGRERPTSMDTERRAVGGSFGRSCEVKGRSQTLQDVFCCRTPRETPLGGCEESIRRPRRSRIRPLIQRFGVAPERTVGPAGMDVSSSLRLPFPSSKQ